MNRCVCAITGHRPSRFKFKYSEDYSLCKKIKANMLEVFRKLHDEQEVSCFYVGGALGVDMWAAEQILRLKEQPGYEVGSAQQAPDGVYPATLQQERSHRKRGLP